jgi:hypothetical protein
MSILVETAYLPPVSYMAEVVNSDAVVIEIFETYKKQTYRNHCAIYGPNGKQILSIPVVKVNGNHTLTKDIRISDHQPWQKTHWRSIETAYNNSPFFLYYQDNLAPFYEKRFSFLLDLNMQLFGILSRILHISCRVGLSDKFEKIPADTADLRNGLVSKNSTITKDYPHYTQVFEPRHGFIPGLSILDLLFNLGPEATGYLEQLKR